MKISTRIAHAKIRFQHMKLRFKVKYPHIYGTFKSLFVIFFMSAGVYVSIIYANQPPAQHAQTFSDNFNIQVKTFSASGVVLENTPNSVKIRISEVVNEGGVNKIVFKNKNLILTSQTQITSQDPQNTELSIGKTIVVYSPNNPTLVNDLIAERVEILIN